MADAPNSFIMPSVSVIIPAFNAAMFIKEAIDSVRNQTLTDWVLIVVDDNSTDATCDTVERIAAEDSRITLLHRNHNSGGAMVPRMEGFHQASTKWVVGLDADDTLSPNYLKEMMNRQMQTESDMVCPRISFMFPDGDVKPYLPDKEIDLSGCYEGRELTVATLDGWKIGLSGALMKRDAACEAYELFLSEGHRTDNPFADELLSRRILLASSRVGFCNSAEYFYRVNVGSVTHQLGESYFSRLDMFKNLIDWVEHEFGADSREYMLSQKMNFMAVIESMRAVNSLKNYAAKRRCLRLIRRNYSLIDFRIVRKCVPRKFHMIMSVGPSVATAIFRIHHSLKQPTDRSR